MALKRYVADFETTSAKQFQETGKTEIWAVAVASIEREEVLFVKNSINHLLYWAFQQNHRNESKLIYFHNLKFDGQFIIDYLLNNGFEHSTERRLLTKQFSTLVSEEGTFYEIKVCLKNYGTWDLTVKFQDSYKKLPFKVEHIAKAFNLPMTKGEIDYDKYREIPHTITPEEEDYIKRDVLIIAKALNIQLKKGMTKMTIGSDSMNKFKQLITKQSYDYNFPELDYTIDNDLRKAYRGGQTWLNNEYADKVMLNVHSFDKNSMYPNVMRNYPLPYGIPKHFDGEYKHNPDYPLFIQVVDVDFTVKPKHIPTIQINHSYRFSTSYVETTDGVSVRLYLTNYDLDLLLSHHDIHSIDYVEGFMFKQHQGFFNEYVDLFYEQKAKAPNPSAERELAKLFLNNLYGKFGSNPRKINMIPYLDKETGIVKWQKGEETLGKTVYVAMAVYITSIARYDLITSGQLFYDNLIYMDTDSLKIHTLSLEEIKKKLNVDDKELGAWKYEGTAEKFKALRAKTYVYIQNGKLEVKCSGLPDRAKEDVTFDNFTYGFKTEKKLQQKRVLGGVILEETQFEIKKPL